MNLNSSGLPSWLGKCSCSRPVAGESNKTEEPPKCSRTFQKPQSIYGRWRSHLHAGKKEEERQADQDEGGQDSGHGKEDPLDSGFQSPLQPVFVRNPHLDPSLCPLFLPLVHSTSSCLLTRVRVVHTKPMALHRPYRFPVCPVPWSRTALTKLNAGLAPALPLLARPAGIQQAQGANSKPAVGRWESNPTAFQKARALQR